MENNKDNKRRIKILGQNPSLGDPFLDMVFGSHTKTNMEVLKGAVLGGIASAELLKELRLAVPICYKINGTIFLKGETKEYDDGYLTELFDMTEEMKSGRSNSLYVGGVSWFAYADAGETEQVKNFLAKA